jgi:hypothetical protein
MHKMRGSHCFRPKLLLTPSRLNKRCPKPEKGTKIRRKKSMAVRRSAIGRTAFLAAEKVGKADLLCAIDGGERQRPQETVEGHGFKPCRKLALWKRPLASANRG